MHHSNDHDHLQRYRHDPHCFGGALLRGNPKGRRPFSANQALHVTMRSSIARGRRSLHEPRHYRRVKEILRRQACRFGVTVYWFANSGNHLHLLLRPPRRRSDFSGFMRALTGLIARAVLRAERSRPGQLKFWDKRPFSRIVPWGRAFRACARYVIKNILEAMGLEEAAVIEAELKAWRSMDKPS